MDAVLRATAVYVFLLLLFRLSGQRSLAQITTFDFVLLLIIAETTQQALLGEDFSLTNAFLLISTLFALNLGLSLWKQRSRRVERVLEGLPIVLVENGRPVREHMKNSLVDEADILQAAREMHGLQRMDQVRFAVLECSGGISIIPMPSASGGNGG